MRKLSNSCKNSVLLFLKLHIFLYFQKYQKYHFLPFLGVLCKLQAIYLVYRNESGTILIGLKGALIWAIPRVSTIIMKNRSFLDLLDSGMRYGSAVAVKAWAGQGVLLVVFVVVKRSLLSHAHACLYHIRRQPGSQHKTTMHAAHTHVSVMPYKEVHFWEMSECSTRIVNFTCWPKVLRGN